MDPKQAITSPSAEKLVLLWNSVKRITSESDTKESTSAEKHERRIRCHYGQLLNSLSASDVVAQMFQSGMLTAKDHEYIQLFRSTPIRASEELLNIILKSNRDVFECFLESLKKTEQHHLYQMLTSDEENISIDEHFASEHSRQIRQNYVRLVESLDPDSGLLTTLFANKVLSCREYEQIGSLKNRMTKNETLLSIISRKSAEDFRKFVFALKDTLQDGIIAILTDTRVANKANPAGCHNSLEKRIPPKPPPPPKPKAQSHALPFRSKPTVIQPLREQKLLPKSKIFQRTRSVSLLESKFVKLQNELQTIVSVKLVQLHRGTSTENIWKLCFEKILQESKNLKRQNIAQSKETSEQCKRLMQEVAWRDSESIRIREDMQTEKIRTENHQRELYETIRDLREDMHKEKIRTKNHQRELHETIHDLEERLNLTVNENMKLSEKLKIAEFTVDSLKSINLHQEQEANEKSSFTGSQTNHEVQSKPEKTLNAENITEPLVESDANNYSVRKEMGHLLEENKHIIKQTEQQQILIEKLKRRCQSYPFLVHTIRTKAGNEYSKDIRGMTIIDKKLFVVNEGSSEVEVYDTKTFNFSDRLNLKELIDPWDIGSCRRNRCLYIMDHRGPLNSSNILRVDPKGKIIKNWSTGDDHGDGISVADDSNVILTVCDKNKLNEYSPDGQLIREINLSPAADVRQPSHSIKLPNDNYVVSHGYSDDDLHRVCIVDATGKLKRSFGGQRGSTEEQMICPEYLAVDGNGSVMVGDRGNSRVLWLNADLGFKREILFRNLYELQSPLRILLDESTARLFVVDNGNNRRILIFDLNN